MSNADSPRAFLKNREGEVFDTLKKICSIPSPTFHEGKKIRHLTRILSGLGLKTFKDKKGNALGLLRADPDDPRLVLLSAHADTALNAPLPIKIRDDGRFLQAHGICDNTAGITALLTFLRYVKQAGISLKQNYLIAFTVQEEGLGAKGGMEALIKKYGRLISYVVNVESHDIGRIVNACVGQYRACLKISARQSGSHSFHDFGEPNAVIILSSVIHDLSGISLPKDSSFNVTAIKGGEKINSIPGEAECLVEFRAKKQKVMDNLVRRFERIFKKHKSGKVSFDLKVLSASEAAGFPKGSPVFRIARRVIKSLKIRPRFGLGNSDGDIPLAAGIPTVTLGSSNGFATHSLEERLEKKTYLKGVGQVIEIILALDRGMR